MGWPSPRRGRVGSSGRAAQKFLTGLDGFKSKALGRPVMVVAATNELWTLDEAILSRFKKRVYVPHRAAGLGRGILAGDGGRGLRLEGITYGGAGQPDRRVLLGVRNGA